LNQYRKKKYIQQKTRIALTVAVAIVVAAVVVAIVAVLVLSLFTVAVLFLNARANCPHIDIKWQTNCASNVLCPSLLFAVCL